MKKLSANIILITAALVLCPHIAEAGQNDAATVHIDLDTAIAGIQTSRNLATNEVFDVEIVINDAFNLIGFNLVVIFPQTILEVQSATEGAFLKSAGASTTVFFPDLNPGIAEVSSAIFGAIPDSQAPDGDGVLVSLSFKVLSVQEANITFSISPSDLQALTDNSGITDDPVALGNANGAIVNEGVVVPKQIVSSADRIGHVGGTLNIPVSYTTSDGNDKLTGLGLRIHYNSSALTFVDLSDLYSNSLIATGTPEADTSDFDGDSSTDKFVNVAWVDFSPPGEWPNEALPIDLYTANFSVSDLLSEGSTSTIGFSQSSDVPGYGFQGTPVLITFTKANWDIDGNGAYNALTDGVLAVRYLFGFTGSVLTDGAVATDATRTTAAEIEDYLATAHTVEMLDIDGNGTDNALTDGVLAVRYLFGFTGSVLTDGAVATDATRTTATEIEEYIASYMPPLVLGTGSETKVLSSVLEAGAGPAQVITPYPLMQYVSPGGPVNIKVSYDTSDGNDKLTGLGLRIHYDSSKLTWDSFSDVFAFGKIGEDVSPQDDTFLNFDGDLSTDKYLKIAWTDFSGQWPNEALPIDLYTANFTISSLSVGETSTIGFSQISPVPGYGFQSTPAKVGQFIIIDPALSSVEATTPVNIDEESIITITARDPGGNPIEGIPPEYIEVFSTGTDYTITQPTTATDASGQTTAKITSTKAQTINISVVMGTILTLNDKPPVEFKDDTQPTVGFSSHSSSGSEALATVTLDVALSKPSAVDVKVNYSVSKGTATGGGEDYTLAAGTLTFSPSSTSELIKITVHEDSLYEGNETIEVTLSSALNATLIETDKIHTYTIEDNETMPSVGFDVDVSEGDENISPAELMVSMSAESSLPTKVYFSVTPGTAKYGQDYTYSTDSYLDFSAGETGPKPIKITIIHDLLDEDDNETFTVTLKYPENAILGTTDHIYTIVDDDDPPTVSFDSAGSEGAEGAEGAVFPLTLVVDLFEASGRIVTVGYTVTGTATGDGVDYTLADGTLTFLPGATKPTEDIILTILGDNDCEPDEETVIVTLSDASVTVLPGKYMSYTYTIVNDDDSSVAFEVDRSEGPEGVSTAELIVTRYPADNDVKVDYSVTGGTAEGGGVDYTLADGTLTFLAGDTEESIKIDITPDDKVEPDETIIVTLTNPTGALIGTNESHTYTILNDDDNTLPEISGFIPKRGADQVARDTIIQLHITDEVIDGTSGTGVALETVSITVENDVIYDGVNENPEGIYKSSKGICRRVGSEADYTFVFQSSTLFDYEQKVEVVVNAKDKAGNVVNEPYHFYTVMRAFAKNIKVNTDTGTLVQNNPATATDSEGNIWVVWDEKTAAGDNTDIYIGKLTADGSAFETSVPVIKGANDQRNPAIAIDASDVLYVVWEEFEEIANPNRDILLLTSTDGNIWKYGSSVEPFQVNVVDPDTKDPHFAQNPAIAISGTEMYVTWDEKRGTNKDIWVRKSDIGQAKFEDATRVTDDASSQSEPAIAIDEFGTAYIVWTDARNAGIRDIYGADSTNWTYNVAVVKISNNQWSPAIATESSGTVLHLLWVDDTDPDASIFYAATDGLQELLEADIHDDVVDEPKYVQSAPAIAVRGAGETAKVFACWQDGRWINKGDVADIYFTESGSGFDDRTNVLVNDDGVDENTQTAPDIGDIGVDKYGNPYIVWVDDRNGNNDIYYAGPITIGEPLDTIVNEDEGFTLVEATTSDDLKVTIKIPDQPLGVLPSEITIREIDVTDLPALPPGSFGVPYDLGPSGLEFDPGVTITIQHAEADCPDHSTYLVFWYNTQTGEWSPEGGILANHVEISPTLHAVVFETTHFTGFGTGGFTPAPGPTPPGGGGGGGGGGCDMSPNSQGNVIEYMLPYVFLTIVWIIIKRKDARNRKTIV